MDRMFDDDLDALLATSEDPIGRATVFAQNIGATMRNSLHYVVPSPACWKLAQQVIHSGASLIDADRNSIFNGDRALKLALKAFKADIKALRAELHKCPPSEDLKALGVA